MPSRQYIRHPIDIPIEFILDTAVEPKKKHPFLKNVSQGGLCFISNSKIDIGNGIQIVIPLCQPTFKASGIVAWCQATNGGRFDIGIEFHDESIHFALRMVEQLCHIEQYKLEMLKEEGRELSNEEAAAEWISKYAGQFPR